MRHRHLPPARRGRAFQPGGSRASVRVAILLAMCAVLVALPDASRAAFEIRPGGDALSTHLPLLLPTPFTRGGVGSPLGTEFGALVLHPFGWRDLRLDALVFRDTRRAGAWGISCRRLEAGGYAEWSGEVWTRASMGLGVGLFHARTAPGVELRRDLGFQVRETTALSLSAAMPEMHRSIALELGAHDLAAGAGAARLGVRPRGTLSARFHPDPFEVRYVREWPLGMQSTDPRSECALLVDLTPSIGLGLGFGSEPSVVKLSIEGRWGAVRASVFQTQRGLERDPTRGLAVGYRRVRKPRPEGGADSVASGAGRPALARPSIGNVWDVQEEWPAFLLEADSLFSIGDSLAIRAAEVSTFLEAQAQTSVLGDTAAIRLLASRRGWHEDRTRSELWALIEGVHAGGAAPDSGALRALYLDYWPSFRETPALRGHGSGQTRGQSPSLESNEMQSSIAAISCEIKTRWTRAASGGRRSTTLRSSVRRGQLHLLGELEAAPGEGAAVLRDLGVRTGALSGWFASGVLVPRFGNGLLGAGAESMRFTRSTLRAGLPGPTVERRASAGKSVGVGFEAAGVEALVLASDERSARATRMTGVHLRTAEFSMALSAWRAGLLVDLLPRRPPAASFALRRNLHATVASIEVAGEGSCRMLSLRLSTPPERNRAGITLKSDERLAGAGAVATRLRPRRFDRQLRLHHSGGNLHRTLELHWRADLPGREGRAARELRRADLEYVRREGPHAGWQTLLRAETSSSWSATHGKLRLRVATDGVRVGSGRDGALECGLELRERKTRVESRATRAGDLFWAAIGSHRVLRRGADMRIGVLGARAEVASGSVAPRGLGGGLRVVVRDETVAAFARLELVRGPVRAAVAIVSSSGRAAEKRSVFELTWRASSPRSVEQASDLR